MSITEALCVFLIFVFGSAFVLGAALLVMPITDKRKGPTAFLP